MQRLLVIATFLVMLQRPDPAFGEPAPQHSPTALSQEIAALAATARSARESIVQARKQMIPLAVTRAGLQESLRIQREEFAAHLRAARAAFWPPVDSGAAAAKSMPLPSLELLKIAQAEYAEVLRLGGATSADADRLSRTEAEIDRLMRAVRAAAERARAASLRAQALSQRLRSRARAAAWISAKTPTESTRRDAAELEARALTAAEQVIQAEHAALAASSESIRCRGLVRLGPESAAARIALSEAVRAKLLADFAAAKSASEHVEAAIAARRATPAPPPNNTKTRIRVASLPVR